MFSIRAINITVLLLQHSEFFLELSNHELRVLLSPLMLLFDFNLILNDFIYFQEEIEGISLLINEFLLSLSPQPLVYITQELFFIFFIACPTLGVLFDQHCCLAHHWDYFVRVCEDRASLRIELILEKRLVDILFGVKPLSFLLYEGHLYFLRRGQVLLPLGHIEVNESVGSVSTPQELLSVLFFHLVEQFVHLVLVLALDE